MKAVEEKERLRQAYDELRRFVYGRRQERFDDPAQKPLFPREPDETSALGEFRQWLDAVAPRVLPKSKIGEAVSRPLASTSIRRQ